ncbi:MAG: fused MFS/spermidine synthase, partial [Ilumatobacteraceae bacterium]
MPGSRRTVPLVHVEHHRTPRPPPPASPSEGLSAPEGLRPRWGARNPPGHETLGWEGVGRFRGMDRRLAGALVFCASGAVLVLEILAGRLLAPYVGVSLATFTGIIGVVLAGISLGAW